MVFNEDDFPELKKEPPEDSLEVLERDANKYLWITVICILVIVALFTSTPAKSAPLVGYELEVACLALNIFHEAGFEPIHGQYAVALVTVNRAKERRLKICDTVFQDKQFSWANGARDSRGKLLPRFVPSGKRWEHAKRIARVTLSGEIVDFTGGATHYHADYIPQPTWAAELQPRGKWGHHYFYR